MVFFEDNIAGDSRFSLADALDYAEFEFREDFLDHWGLEDEECPESLDHDEWIECRTIYDLAKQIAGVATTLLHRKGLGEDRLARPDLWRAESNGRQQEVRKLLEKIAHLPDSVRWQIEKALWPTEPSDPRTKYNIFRNSMQLHAAELVRVSGADVAQRLSALVNQLARSADARTASYLERVAKCYVLNLPTEFAVMARSVLDSAIESQVDNEAVVALLGQRGRSSIGLKRRIEYCAATDIFDSETERAATRVRETGDDAVHLAPGIVYDMDSLLQDLIKCLAAIDSASERPGHES
jgi:hypothetical protein